jgi:maltooligosyltrehalose trehalohydrolase
MPAPVRRRHDMSFGSRLLAAGGANFRLWAPGASRVELGLRPPAAGRRRPLAERVYEMAAGTGGWYEVTVAATEGAVAGAQYRFRPDGGLWVPDPASRYQPQDVHGPSELVDPEGFAWSDGEWRGRPWEQVVLYELHVGTFTPAGTFAAIEPHLDELAALGVTAIELMPVADFPGRRDWGYDGVLPFAPDSAYGRPEDLKRLVAAAHARGLMVFLDVVYNHFGPEGNYLHVYAPAFFTERHITPWGAAIDFDGPHSGPVRDFFVHNALYWLQEYHLDGLRLDAVHAIRDASPVHILTELADRVHAALGDAAGRPGRRHVHLVLENDSNESRYLMRAPDRRPRLYVAQWNDDIHHALHVALTGEGSGYYGDYVSAPAKWLGRCLAEGFAYQGEISRFRDDTARGEPSRDLPPTAFVSFLQNHDQVGNRAFGERILELAPEGAVRAALTIILLAPSPPLLFMGEEFGCRQPFLFFCDFGPELAPRVREGRREEFRRFPEFADSRARERIPDPAAERTFARVVLDRQAAATRSGRSWRTFYADLLALRAREIVPRLVDMPGGSARYEVHPSGAVTVGWTLGDGSRLHLEANLQARAAEVPGRPDEGLLYGWPPGAAAPMAGGAMEAWAAVWYLARA